MDITQHHQNVNYMDGSHLPFLYKLSLQIPFPQAPHYRSEQNSLIWHLKIKQRFSSDQMLTSSDYHKVWNPWDWIKGNAAIIHWSSHNSIKADGYTNHKHLLSSPDNHGVIFTACQSTQHSPNLKHWSWTCTWIIRKEERRERPASHLPNSLYTSF